MTREQAAKFILAWNRAVYDLAPSRAEPVSDSDVMRMILAVANGAAICELKPPLPPEPAKPPATD